MAKDQRLYAKFTLDFPDHHKIKPLSDAAFRALMEMIFWSRRNLTDGFVPKRFALASWSLDVCFELLHNDDENPSLIELENGYQIRDFAEHQTTKAEIEGRRQIRRTAGQKGGIASGRSRREAKAKQTAKQTSSKTNPETETETEITTTHLSGKQTLVAREPLDAESATSGSDLVRQIIPREHPDAVTTMLRVRASELINTGTPPPIVAAALELWLTKPNLGPNTLPSLVSEVIKARAGPSTNGVGKPTQKALGYQAAAERIIANLEENP